MRLKQAHTCYTLTATASVSWTRHSQKSQRTAKLTAATKHTMEHTAVPKHKKDHGIMASSKQSITDSFSELYLLFIRFD
jgi:hypothetical protein